MKRLVILCVMVCLGGSVRADAGRDQADALERMARAEEMRNAVSGSGGVPAVSCPNLEGGSVPEGCELRFLKTPKDEIATGKGPDGRRHAVYLLYCPTDR